MKARLGHIETNVKDPKTSLPFYKDLFKYFDYKIVSDQEDHIGAASGTVDFWITATKDKYKSNRFHRKNTGINHICFRVNTKKDVDKFCNEFLKPRGITTLYDTPKLFPEYCHDYYAVFFEDPDRIKLEITYYND